MCFGDTNKYDQSMISNDRDGKCGEGVARHNTKEQQNKKDFTFIFRAMYVDTYVPYNDYTNRVVSCLV